MQRLHRLLHRRAVVEAVDDVKVQVVRTQPPERAVDLAADRLRAQVPFVKVHLGGQHHLVPRDVCADGLAQVLLARARRVGVRRVEEIDAQVERVADDRPALLRVQRPGVHLARRVAKAHAADAQPRNLDARMPQFCVFHKGPPSAADAASVLLYRIHPGAYSSAREKTQLFRKT